METMTNELTVIPGTIGMMGGMGMLKPEFIEDAVIVSEEQEEHPNFIESNTSGITLEVQSAKPPVHLFKTKRFYFEVLFQNEASLLEQNQTAFKWTSNPI